MNIRIGFSKRKGFAPLSWAIMACERTNFSHVFIEFYSKSLDRKLIYHATGSGVIFVGEKVFEDHNQVVKEFQLDITEEKYLNLLRWCVDQAGKPYSKRQILLIGYRRFMSLMGVNIVISPDNNCAKYICSELVARALIELGYHVETENLDTFGLKELEVFLSTI